MKLFWKIYLVLTVTTLITLILVIWTSFSVLPGFLENKRNSVLDAFQEQIESGSYTNRSEIRALADSMGIFLRMVAEDDVQGMHGPQMQPGPQPQPPPDDIRDFRLIAIPGTHVSVVATARIPAPRFLMFAAFALILFVSQAIALALGLRSVFRRTTALTKATADFGKGRFTSRYPHSGRGGDEIDNMGAAFNTMAERILSLLDSHNELLNSVAHELRTPLARLSFALELAKQNPETVKEKLGLMEKDLFELDKLVTELLEFNRIRNSEPEMLKVCLNDVCSEAADAERIHNPSVDITVLSPTGRIHVPGDHRLLLRAVSNLVRNAVRHAGSEVVIALSSSGGEATAAVNDDGPGFPPGFAERATEPFVKGENSKGSGLGLSIVKRIAEKHRGSLLLSRSSSGGASAELILPLK